MPSGGSTGNVCTSASLTFNYCTLFLCKGLGNTVLQSSVFHTYWKPKVNGSLLHMESKVCNLSMNPCSCTPWYPRITLLHVQMYCKTPLLPLLQLLVCSHALWWIDTPQKNPQTYTVSIANCLFVVNEKCAIRWVGEREERGVGDGRCLWSILWWRGCQWIGGRQEKALEFTVVSEKLSWEGGHRVYWKNERTTCFNLHFD